MPKTKTPPPPPIDMYRGSNMRFLGYAHVVGTALRPLVNSLFINVSYAVSISYICADLFDKASKTGNDAKKMNQTAGDVILWHAFATMIIPGFAINKLTYYTCRFLRKSRVSRQMIRIVPAVVGLAAIPLIITPIDAVTDEVMDKTYRKWIYEKK